MGKKLKPSNKPLEYPTEPEDLMAFMLIDDPPIYNGEEIPWPEPLIVT